MKIAQLKALVKRGESQTLEFKSSAKGLKAGMKTVCAFLNSDQGGTELIGVRDDGKIIGQDVTDATRREVAGEIKKIEPLPKIGIQYVRVAGAGFKLSTLTISHDSMPRNPLIANAFWLYKKIERWGRGTLDMIRDCEKAGNPPPQFAEVGGSFLVILPFKESMRTIIYEEPKKIFTRLTDRQKSIISVLQSGPLNRIEIMTKAKLKLTDRVMQLELNKLKKLGLIKSEGKAQASIWFLIK